MNESRVVRGESKEQERARPGAGGARSLIRFREQAGAGRELRIINGIGGSVSDSHRLVIV